MFNSLVCEIGENAVGLQYGRDASANSANIPEKLFP